MTATSLGATAPLITRVQLRHVKRHIQHAISARCCCPTEGLISIERDPLDLAAVLVHVNSGGNATAADNYLTRRGYVVERITGNQHAGSTYGVRLRIRATPPTTGVS